MGCFEPLNYVRKKDIGFKNFSSSLNDAIENSTMKVNLYLWFPSKYGYYDLGLD